jgi:hypothetical protein
MCHCCNSLMRCNHSWVTDWPLSIHELLIDHCPFLLSPVRLSESDGSKNTTHNMVYLYNACDQISDFCHQQLLRKMRRKISWTDGSTNRRTEVKQYTHFSQQLLMAEIWYLVTSFIYGGKRFWTHQILTSCLPILLIFIHI